MQGYSVDQDFKATEANPGSTPQRYWLIVFPGFRGGFFKVERGTIRAPGLRGSVGEQGEGTGSIAVNHYPSWVALEMFGFGKLWMDVG